MSKEAVLSPMQPGEYIKREEFSKLESKMDDGFGQSFKMTESVEKKVDDLKNHVDDRFDRLDDNFAGIDERFTAVDNMFNGQKAYMDTGFMKLGEQIDAVESNLGKKIDLLAGDVSWLRRSVGKLLKKAGVS